MVSGVQHDWIELLPRFVRTHPMNAYPLLFPVSLSYRIFTEVIRTFFPSVSCTASSKSFSLQSQSKPPICVKANVMNTVRYQGLSKRRAKKIRAPKSCVHRALP